MTLTYITNGTMTVGIDLARGATPFSLKGADGVERSMGEGMPLSLWGYGAEFSDQFWNPNQTGYYPSGQYSPVLDSDVQVDSLYAKVDSLLFYNVGTDWDGGEVPPSDTFIEVWYDFPSADVFRVRSKCTYYGSEDHSPNAGELDPNAHNGLWLHEAPACFCPPDYVEVATYVGDSPGTGGALTTFPVPASNDSIIRYDYSEKWAAILKSDGIGLGMMNTAQALTTVLSVAPWAVYLTPCVEHNFSSSDPILETETLYSVGTAAQIRSTFAPSDDNLYFDLADSFGVFAAGSATDADSGSGTAAEAAQAGGSGAATDAATATVAEVAAAAGHGVDGDAASGDATAQTPGGAYGHGTDADSAGGAAGDITGAAGAGTATDAGSGAAGATETAAGSGAAVDSGQGSASGGGTAPASHRNAHPILSASGDSHATMTSDDAPHVVFGGE